MPEARQLVRLFESLSRRDVGSMETCALRIADQEERKGHTHVAKLLRSALNRRDAAAATEWNESSEIESNGSNFLLAKAIIRMPDAHPLDDVVMESSARKSLEEVILEFHAKQQLKKSGISRRSRLLFHGPPGCGKTMCALAIARELRLPAYLVRFNALIGSFLGQTALQLHEVFHFASRNACVLVLDEVDVLGKHRGNQMDVGELDRIVVGLMQELELTTPRGLVIAASNLPAHLDEALWRRFDLHLEFKAPTKPALLAFLKSKAACHGVEITKSLKMACEQAKDYAAVEKLVLDEARRKILTLYQM